MNRQKRDRTATVFNHGYRAGLDGRSMQICPYESVIDLRGIWLGGWRQGRDQYNWGATRPRTADINAAMF